MSKFQAKARAIELLGRKQIRDSITALAELMKNSYDADASWLRVEFHTSSPESLIIADSGCGMSKNDIEQKWLVLGTNSKTSNKAKLSADGRPLMGAKGIGRLASARLGKQLWMITKSDKDNWNIIFINWDIFENPHIALDEISIPSKYNIPANELIMTFDTIKNQLISEQMKNMLLSAWFETDDEGTPIRDTSDGYIVREDISVLYDSTVNNINASSLTGNDMRKYISSLEHGTVIFIDALNDDWGRYLAARSTDARDNDAIIQKYYNRFASFVSTFRHPKVNKIPFKLEVYIDNNIWEEDFSYNEEDYGIYDIKITGYVENGKFYGKVDALNAEEGLLKRCNDSLGNGIEVTSGITNWKEIDCGRYTIKLCHIEGEANSSGLSEDDYSRIKRKLDIACGVLIFRDGVRVLPYGEPENDFLSMEKRRSQNAGLYIFSHRNIFGQVDINSVDNPLLEDKSSREGLIENNQYFYFVKTIENLLTELAFNYLSKARKGSLGIRQSFVDKNRAAAEAKKQAVEFEKSELAASKQAIKATEDKIVAAKKSVADLDIRCDDFIAKSVLLLAAVSLGDGYNAIRKSWDTIITVHNNLTSELEGIGDAYLIEIPKRYAHYYSEDLVKSVLTNNEFIKTSIQDMRGKIDYEYHNANRQFNALINSWEEAARASVLDDPHKYKETLEDRLAQVIENSRAQITSLIEFVDETSEAINGDLTNVKVFIETVRIYKESLEKSESFLSVHKLIDAVSNNAEQISSIFVGNPDELYERGNNILSCVEKEYQNIYNHIELLRLASSNELGELRKQAGVYAACASEMSMPDEYVIGLLRQENVRLQAENDIYGDLANLGLAAEIVSHEFNQLFSNVNNAIRNLSPYIKDNSAKYWLSQIQTSFRAISDRQNQLSPMYRSYSLRKQEINLRDFIDRVCRFMENVFTRDGIVIENRVDASITLVASPSKLFPALSNIVNNASYWVLSKDEKIIRFRYDENASALFVEDSGVGITAIDKESVFEPFVSYRPNGRGLGLAIVRKVLDSQGYSITIDESEKTLPGACFKINFKSAEVL